MYNPHDFVLTGLLGLLDGVTVAELSELMGMKPKGGYMKLSTGPLRTKEEVNVFVDNVQDRTGLRRDTNSIVYNPLVATSEQVKLIHNKDITNKEVLYTKHFGGKDWAGGYLRPFKHNYQYGFDLKEVPYLIGKQIFDAVRKDDDTGRALNDFYFQFDAMMVQFSRQFKESGDLFILALEQFSQGPAVQIKLKKSFEHHKRGDYEVIKKVYNAIFRGVNVSMMLQFWLCIQLLDKTTSDLQAFICVAALALLLDKQALNQLMYTWFAQLPGTLYLNGWKIGLAGFLSGIAFTEIFSYMNPKPVSGHSTVQGFVSGFDIDQIVLRAWQRKASWGEFGASAPSLYVGGTFVKQFLTEGNSGGIATSHFGHFLSMFVGGVVRYFIRWKFKA